MNSFLEEIFGKAKENYFESVTSVFEVEDGLFTKIPRLHKIYRMPYFSGRRYFTQDSGDPYLMSGLTMFSKKIVSRRSGDVVLQGWREKKIEEGLDPDEIAWMAAEFGTLVHIVAASVFSARARKQSFSTRGLDSELKNYMATIGVNVYHFKEWYRNLCAAIRSLNAFYSKSEMDVYAIEFCVADFQNNICTPLDIICEITSTESVDVPMKTKEGTKKEKRQRRDIWNLNIKARQNSDRRDNDKYQICAEQYIANGYLPQEFQIAKTGVLSPVWTWKVRENADCKLHDFTGYFSQEDWNIYLRDFRNEPGGINDDLFFPDLTQNIGDSNVFNITEYGDVVESPQMSIADFIMSHFKN